MIRNRLNNTITLQLHSPSRKFLYGRRRSVTNLLAGTILRFATLPSGGLGADIQLSAKNL